MNDVITIEAENVAEARPINPHALHYATPFERVVKALAQELRRAFDHADLNHVRFSASISGRTHGDLEISFEMSDQSWGGEVKACSIQAIMDELLRRHGWNKRHAPTAIGYDGADKDSEDIF